MNDELETIDPRLLAHVSGGRKIHGPVQIGPEVIQGIQQLKEAVVGVGQQISQSIQANAQGYMQMFQKMMEQKQQEGGGGGGGARPGGLFGRR